VITSSQILFSLPDSINKHYPWLQAHEFYNFSLIIVSTLLDFLICGSHCCRVLSNFILVSLPTSIIFLGVPPPLPPNPLNCFLLCDFVLIASNPSEFLHYYLCALYNMVTFHIIGRSDLIIMVYDSKTTIIFEHCMCDMFVFQPSSLHISKDVSHDFNNFVSSSLY
jgi:hypothetical protein